MSKASILLVEDNPGEADLVREAIAEVNQDIVLTVVDSVFAALSLLAALPEHELPNLVITDHHLSDKRGHELIAQLLACPRNCRLPVVMVSGDAVRPTDLGDTVWFSKPDTWADWCGLAQKLVGRIAPG